MTYAMGESVQVAVYGALAGDPVLDGMVGGVFDAVPLAAPELFVALGPEDVRGRGDATGAGAVHELRVSVVTSGDGFLAAKRAAARVSEVLDAPLAMTRGRMVSLRFAKARARRDEGEGTRRIDLWFRARVDQEEGEA